MKNKTTNKIKFLLLLLVAMGTLASCEYQEVTDADYPNQLLYMPAAVNGLFIIENLPEDPEYVPTPGHTYQFVVDEENNKFTVPLSVYRSGLDRNANINVDISVQNDTIANLIEAASIPENTMVLSSEEYTLPSTVVVEDGSEIGKFNLDIDLDYLISIPDQIVALAVNISSSDAAVNEEYQTTVIIIHTKVLNQEQ